VRDPGAPFWVPSSALQRHLNHAASGDPGVDWLTHVRSRHLAARIPRTLVVGCGEGHVERALVRMPGVGEILAVDADAVVLEKARRRTRSLAMASVAHAVWDPDLQPPPEGPFDAVLVQGVLHHAADPEGTLRALRSVLSPRGRIAFLDYVGPNRFAYPEAAQAIARRYSRMLPERLLRDPRSGSREWRPAFPDPAELARSHPREAARSEDLLGLARRVFREESVRGAGGALLHPLLSGREGNFGADRDGDERVLAVLCAAERHLLEDESLRDPFALFVGRPREAAAG
jgi:SAM-dependent methyltransferase